jgi:hypothetical protein
LTAALYLIEDNASIPGASTTPNAARAQFK